MGKESTMELVTLYKRVVGLDVHQAKITACAILEDESGEVTVELALGAHQN